MGGLGYDVQKVHFHFKGVFFDTVEFVLDDFSGTHYFDNEIKNAIDILIPRFDAKKLKMHHFPKMSFKISS